MGKLFIPNKRKKKLYSKAFKEGRILFDSYFVNNHDGIGSLRRALSMSLLYFIDHYKERHRPNLIKNFVRGIYHEAKKWGHMRGMHKMPYTINLSYVRTAEDLYREYIKSGGRANGPV